MSEDRSKEELMEQCLQGEREACIELGFTQAITERLKWTRTDTIELIFFGFFSVILPIAILLDLFAFGIIDPSWHIFNAGVFVFYAILFNRKLAKYRKREQM